jgi:hypothetical protein
MEHAPDETMRVNTGSSSVVTGIGALIGWAIDAANSKPHITFDAPSGRRAKVSVQPLYLRGRTRGVILTIREWNSPSGRPCVRHGQDPGHAGAQRGTVDLDPARPR